MGSGPFTEGINRGAVQNPKLIEYPTAPIAGSRPEMDQLEDLLGSTGKRFKQPYVSHVGEGRRQREF